MEILDERDKGIVYIKVVTDLVNVISKMMIELNETCQEICREILKQSAILADAIFPVPPGLELGYEDSLT